MNRLTTLFGTDKKRLLSVYFTAGYPALGTVVPLAEALEKARVDFVEIGFPYSDPVADGPTIQKSSQQALENGMTLARLFEELKELRRHVRMPVLLMGYLNPVMQFGIERFCQAAAAVGVDGIIIPDLPMHEYEHFYASYFNDNGLSNIFLVTPQTSPERIRKIDELSSSFIYLLSSSSITGKKLEMSDTIEEYYARVRDMQLKHPAVIGFGISGRSAFDKACEYARGAIVGSEFVKFLGTENYMERISAFVTSIRD